MTDIWLPDNFDYDRLLDINTASISNPKHRRRVCEYDPLLFAIIYLWHHLKSVETGDKVSLNEFHIDICDGAISWAFCEHAPKPKEFRDCWIAPRGCGKSTWMFLIIPLWAAAYGHRKYIAMFADSGKQAKQHLDSILQEFRTNEKLKTDFPKLCKSREQKGGDTANEYRSVSRITFTAYGIDASTLGAKSENQRPDFLVFDDIEPPGNKFNETQKEARLDAIRNSILPMNFNAVAWIAGTTVAYGSVIHDVVRNALGALELRWVAEENIRAHYYPAIITDPDGSERSLWPERWPMSYLEEERNKKSFMLNMMNNPTGGTVDATTGEVKGEYWDEDDFSYETPWQVHDGVLVIDPATTSKSASDQTGIAIISTNAAEDRTCVEYAVGLRLKPKALREWVLDHLELNPWISTLLIETNQGGDYIHENLKPLPKNIQVVERHEGKTDRTSQIAKGRNSKKFRIRQFLDYDERGWVSYREKFPALHNQQIMFPHVLHDDVLDATAKGVHYWLHDNLPRR